MMAVSTNRKVSNTSAKRNINTLRKPGRQEKDFFEFLDSLEILCFFFVNMIGLFQMAEELRKLLFYDPLILFQSLDPIARLTATVSDGKHSQIIGRKFVDDSVRKLSQPTPPNIPR